MDKSHNISAGDIYTIPSTDNYYGVITQVDGDYVSYNLFSIRQSIKDIFAYVKDINRAKSLVKKIVINPTNISITERYVTTVDPETFEDISTETYLTIDCVADFESNRELFDSNFFEHHGTATLDTMQQGILCNDTIPIAFELKKH